MKLLFKRLWLCILDLIDFLKCTVQGNSNWKANNAPECSKCWCINLKKWIMLTPAIYFIKKCLLCSINKTPKVHVQVNINIYTLFKKVFKIILTCMLHNWFIFTWHGIVLMDNFITFCVPFCNLIKTGFSIFRVKLSKRIPFLN